MIFASVPKEQGLRTVLRVLLNCGRKRLDPTDHLLVQRGLVWVFSTVSLPRLEEVSVPSRFAGQDSRIFFEELISPKALILCIKVVASFIPFDIIKSIFIEFRLSPENKNSGDDIEHHCHNTINTLDKG